jgi:hypothetical protein
MTYLSEITRMVLVEQNTMMMLATSVTTATRVRSVLANTTMASRHMSSLLAVVVKTGRHLLKLTFIGNLSAPIILRGKGTYQMQRHHMWGKGICK